MDALHEKYNELKAQVDLYNTYYERALQARKQRLLEVLTNYCVEEDLIYDDWYNSLRINKKHRDSKQSICEITNLKFGSQDIKLEVFMGNIIKDLTLLEYLEKVQDIIINQHTDSSENGMIKLYKKHLDEAQQNMRTFRYEGIDTIEEIIMDSLLIDGVYNVEYYFELKIGGRMRYNITQLKYTINESGRSGDLFITCNNDKLFFKNYSVKNLYGIARSLSYNLYERIFD